MEGAHIHTTQGISLIEITKEFNAHHFVRHKWCMNFVSISRHSLTLSEWK
jgi:hypothetical protein